MLSTMQDHPLTLTGIFRHGQRIYADSEVVTFLGDGVKRASFAQVAERAERFAAALARLGVRRGDRVATFAWNQQEHMEAYLAIPCMGAVLHTLNPRLFPDQICYIANHAEDKVVVVDGTLVEPLSRHARELKTVEHFIVIGDANLSLLPNAARYEDLLAAEKPGYAWPDLDEREAAVMCYTSGTTGNPKGVVYSHRSNYLHSFAATSGASFGISERDRLLLIAPIFHANAWGLPLAGWMTGADLLLPNRFLQAEPLCRFIAAEKPTFSGAVPTIWNDILRLAETTKVDFSTLKRVACGGSAVPRRLMEEMEKRHGVRIIQAWGMTETSPIATIAHPPEDARPEEEYEWRSKAGRIVAGVELRIVGPSGEVLPWDGESAGEIEVRGPWITASYYKDPSPDKFHDGWLRTGDVGMVDPKGFVRITDRAKDVIKSGGEWISSVDLENALMAHPEVREAAVIGVPDDRWQERPLACVVVKEGAKLEPAALSDFLAARVARWWVPERWTFIPEVPRTSVGKFDKKVLRARYAAGELAVKEHGKAAR